MELDPSIRKTGVKTIAFLIAVLIGLVSLIGYLVNDAKDSTAQASRIPVTRHSMLSTASHVAASVADTKGAEAGEERWAADESSQGSRSDAAH